MKKTDKARNFIKAFVTHTLDFELERMPFQLKNISSKKLIAMFRSEVNCSRAFPKTPWYPVRIQLEPTSICTLKCPLCPLGSNAMVRDRHHMPMNIYKDIIDEFGDYAVYMQMWMFGEPLLNPDMPEMIAYATSRNIAVSTSTNGQHIQTREDAERLVASGLNNLIIAIDGATEESFSYYRKGGQLSKVINCLDLISQAKKSLGSSKPGINVRTVVMKHNEHELADIERIARQHGADMISKKTAFTSDHYGPDAHDEFVPDNPNYQRFKYNDKNKKHVSDKLFYCRRPWDRISISCDGVVMPCEYDFNTDYSFGKKTDTNSYMQTWTGKTATEFRNNFLKDKRIYKCCDNCSCGWVGQKEGTTKEIIHLAEMASR